MRELQRRVTTAWMEQSPGLYRGNKGKELHHRSGWMVQCRSPWSDFSRWCNMALNKDYERWKEEVYSKRQSLVASPPGISRIMTGQNPSILYHYTPPLPEEKRGVYILQFFRRLQVLAREGYSCLRSEYVSVLKDTLSVYIEFDEETSQMNIIEVLKQFQHQLNICFLRFY